MKRIKDWNKSTLYIIVLSIILCFFIFIMPIILHTNNEESKEPDIKIRTKIEIIDDNPNFHIRNIYDENGKLITSITKDYITGVTFIYKYKMIEDKEISQKYYMVLDEVISYDENGKEITENKDYNKVGD